MRSSSSSTSPRTCRRRGSWSGRLAPNHSDAHTAAASNAPIAIAVVAAARCAVRAPCCVLVLMLMLLVRIAAMAAALAALPRRVRGRRGRHAAVHLVPLLCDAARRCPAVAVCSLVAPPSLPSLALRFFSARRSDALTSLPIAKDGGKSSPGGMVL